MTRGLALWTLLGIWGLAAATGPAVAGDEARAWQAGTAVVVITPAEPMWMAGYAARDKPAEGTEQELFGKVLALQDAAGTRLVIVTLDLIGVPRALRDAVAARASREYGLPPQSLLLNASHTHCGPELRASKASLYGLEAARVAQARQYVETLEGKLVDAIGTALAQLAPARVGYSRARCGFAMNRRLPTPAGIRNSPNPEGPVDHDVPVLRVDDPAGNLRAVLFGYACHNTTLSFYRFCGDYAGYAQQYVEEAHPGAVAMFLMGCGGDQNPYPRRTLDLARQHGRTLANAVETALLPDPRPLEGPLRCALDEAALEFAPPPSRETLLEQQKSGNRYVARHAERLLEQLDSQGSIPLEYPYPVQVIRFGDDLALIALAGEVVVDYALRLKRETGDAAVWVAGYSNDVFGYVPSVRVLREGGYEGGGAMVYTSLPGPFAESVEQRIIERVDALLAETQSPPGNE